jgi:hypothetical protein
MKVQGISHLIALVSNIDVIQLTEYCIRIQGAGLTRVRLLSMVLNNEFN